jgi:lipoprotein-anchoring transpeptidase ErfK/SrfK
MKAAQSKFVLVLVSSLFLIIVIATKSYLPTGMNAFQTKQVDDLSCVSESHTGALDPTQLIAYFEGQEISLSTIVMDTRETTVLGVSNSNKWIEVDLSDQKLYAWDSGNKYLETSISSGLPWTPTPPGEYRIWIKLRSAKMEGGEGKYYYYLPNVPYVMYLESDTVPAWKGYGLHGAYWHNDFGTRRSHGCVNLPIPIAKQLYEWTDPVLPAGKSVVKATDDNPGTRVVIHE